MIGSVETTDPNFNWRSPIGKLWSNREKRQQFEKEMNFPTLIEETNPRTEILKEAQIQSGIVEDYYDEFVVWGIRHLGLEDKVRVILLDKAKPTDTVN